MRDTQEMLELKAMSMHRLTVRLDDHTAIVSLLFIWELETEERRFCMETLDLVELDEL